MLLQERYRERTGHRVGIASGNSDAFGRSYHFKSPLWNPHAQPRFLFYRKLSWYGFDTPLFSLSRFLCAAFGGRLGPRRRYVDRRQKRQETMVSGQARPGLSQFLTRISQKRIKPKLSAGDARGGLLKGGFARRYPNCHRQFGPLPFSFPPLSLMQEMGPRTMEHRVGKGGTAERMSHSRLRGCE